MDKLLIFGGTSLKGSVTISGAKKTLLFQSWHQLYLLKEFILLKKIPKLRDVFTMTELIKRMGGIVEFNEVCRIDTTKINRFEASYDLVKTMRASILVLGPLVARFGRAKVSLPGGCAIGARPVNLHIMGLEKNGCQNIS